MTNTRRL